MQPDEPGRKCEMCLRLGVKERKAAVIWICRHCQIKMCQDCIDCHIALKLDTISLTGKKCKQHPEYDMTTYCYGDESGHCGKCESTWICSYKYHRTDNTRIPISDAATVLKEKLKTYMCDLGNMQSLFAEQEGILNSQEQNLREMFTVKEKQIHAINEQIVNLVNEQISFFKTKLNSQKRLSSESIESLRKKLRNEQLTWKTFGLFLEDLVDNGNPFVLARSMKDLKVTVEKFKLEPITKAEEHADSYFLQSHDDSNSTQADKVSSQIYSKWRNY